ncbi:MAG TPA: zf-HC2 domain-containing protein [Burkholderiales bacterium]|nr:zf-HC2 domain-containing protein [Burkholderiales bacterium]
MCKDPIALETLAGWWLGELPASEAERVEAHFFACAHCAGRAEWLAALSEGVRVALRSGAFGMAVSAPFVEEMKRAGLRLREYRNDPGGRLNCTMAADDDAVVSRLRAPLAGVKRLDMVQRVEVPGAPALEIRLDDVPFDPASGEVLLVLPPAALKKMPAHTASMRLFAVGGQEARLLGEYTFSHTPS